MRNRFWGGTGLFYHPNSLAGLVVIAAVRVGFDRAFAGWQRLGVAVLAALVLSISDSRTGFVFAAAAAGAHAVVVLLHWRPRARTLEHGAGPLGRVAMPFVVLATVFTIGGGSDFLFRDRFTAAAVTSPAAAPTPGVRCGSTGSTPAGRRSPSATRRPPGPWSPRQRRRPDEGPRRELNTDNAAVGAFRRGGVLGAIGFLFGVALLLWHALRGRTRWSPPPGSRQPALVHGRRRRRGSDDHHRGLAHRRHQRRASGCCCSPARPAPTGAEPAPGRAGPEPVDRTGRRPSERQHVRRQGARA